LEQKGVGTDNAK